MSEFYTPNPEGPVVVIGAAGMDLVGRLEGELHLGTSNPSRIRSSHGGTARNIAENLGRLGQGVSLISAVGDDQSGDQILEKLREAHVNVEAVLRVKEVPTGTYLAVINTHGELALALDDMRPIASLTPQFLKQHSRLIAQASLIVLDANLSPAALRTVFSLANQYDIPVCADPTSNTLAHRLKRYLERLFLVTPNVVEAGILCDLAVGPGHRRQAMQAAKCLVSRGVRIAVVTLAQLGVCYATSETSGYIPAIQTQIVDPTGGGDALTAALLYALLNDIPLDDAVRLGVSAATLTLSHPGAVYPDLSLEKLYDRLVI